jgi:hypothetical protein
LNPGLNPVDVYSEAKARDYRHALLATLSGRAPSARFPHLFLDPRFSWHSGFAWWHAKLAGVIAEFARRTGRSPLRALSFFSRNVAGLQLVPYHSAAFNPTSSARRLPSAVLARSFAHDVLVEKARAGETALVVTHAGRQWGINPGRNIVVYEGSLARGAPLGLNTPGGKLILRHLLRFS